MKKLIYLLSLMTLLQCSNKKEVIVNNTPLSILYLEDEYWIYEGKRFNGILINNHENGKISSKGPVSNGLMDGVWKFYSENSVMIGEVNLINGNRSGLSSFWWNNGEKKSEQYFENDLLEGESKWWDENGNLISSAVYKNGKENGLSQMWYKDGSLKERGEFINGKIIGKWEFWDEDGNLTVKNH